MAAFRIRICIPDAIVLTAAQGIRTGSARVLGVIEEGVQSTHSRSAQSGWTGCGGGRVDLSNKILLAQAIQMKCSWQQPRKRSQSHRRKIWGNFVGHAGRGKINETPVSQWVPATSLVPREATGGKRANKDATQAHSLPHKDS